MSRKNSDIRSLKKGDIILKYEELKRKFAILHEENLKLKTKNENHQNLVAMNNLDNCGYPAQDLCDLGAHIFEWHAEEKWEEVFPCAFCDMRYPTKNDLMTHRKTSIKNKRFQIVDIIKKRKLLVQT